jgi:hypothetical protein
LWLGICRRKCTQRWRCQELVARCVASAWTGCWSSARRTWTKFCLTGQAANANQVCFTGRDGRNESGMPVVKAVLIEPENKPKKEFRPMGASRCVAGRG